MPDVLCLSCLRSVALVGMIRRDSVASGSILLTLNLTPNQNHYLSHAFLFLLYSPYKNHF
ncbi:hypothetical protein FC814_09225 [Escherichia sp. MR]|nr:hypothetical protein FC814_09225 [Escherichia sp. MR]